MRRKAWRRRRWCFRSCRTGLLVAPFFAGLDTEHRPQLQDHRAADRRARRRRKMQAAGLLRASMRLRHARQPGRASTQTLLSDLSDALKAFQDAMAALGTCQQRHRLHALRLRAHVQAGGNARHRPWLGQLRVRHGRRGEGRRLLRNGSRAGAKRAGRPRQGRALDSDDVARAVRRDAVRAGSASPKPTCPTCSPTSALSRTRTWGSCPSCVVATLRRRKRRRRFPPRDSQLGCLRRHRRLRVHVGHARADGNASGAAPTSARDRGGSSRGSGFPWGFDDGERTPNRRFLRPPALVHALVGPGVSYDAGLALPRKRRHSSTIPRSLQCP